MTHPTPSEALAWYRHNSPHEVVSQAERFRDLTVQEQNELLFYMAVHSANAIGDVGTEVGLNFFEMGEKSVEKN